MAKATNPKSAQKAATTKKAVIKKQLVVDEPVGRYINPLTDFGFKRIFGTKEFLIDFLNAVLKIDGGIVDLHYDDKERPGLSEDDRTTIFDLHCTLKNDECIIIEMQNHRQEFFQDRTLYYASRLIQEQGEDKTGKDWDFKLSPVYSVNIANFYLDADKKKRRNNSKYASYVRLLDEETHEVFYKKLTFVFLELPHFNKKEHQLKNSADCWMYVLKNLSKLDHLPETLRNEIFESLFLKAEIAKLTKKDRKNYDRSLKKIRDMNIIVADRERKIASMNIIVADRERKIAVLSKDNAALQKEVAELRRQLGLGATIKRQRRQQRQLDVT